MKKEREKREDLGGIAKRINRYRTGIILLMVLVLALLLVNFTVVRAGGEQILAAVGSKGEMADSEFEKIREAGPWDCILVLGAGLKEDGTPNHMLKDRLKVALELYFRFKNGAAAGEEPVKLLLSGDNGQEGYDEVNAMKRYALDAGVPAADIFLDHAGFSTYDSIYRAKEIFQVEKALVITQTYHQYRALYIARQLGLPAAGVGADQAVYRGQAQRELREVLARDKDFVKLLFRPSPVFLGEAIPISGSGLASHD